MERKTDRSDLKGTDTNLYAEIQWLPVDNLQPHPDNPRLIYREDIIDTIARSITENGFNPCYALLVRPLGTQYQIMETEEHKVTKDDFLLYAGTIALWQGRSLRTPVTKLTETLNF